ncbi:MAG: cyclopropane-fatty-acyl-phospholipid synthase family protein [Thiohalomonadales bacterium]
MHDQKFWNERYASDKYLYGTDPNSFLAENLDLLKGPVLSLSEGEGRNAVFLASHGLQVHGVDNSDVGLTKAQTLAKLRGVEIQTEVANLANYKPENNFYGSVISISAHLPSEIRSNLYPLVEQCLKLDGTILLEAYSESQLTRNTGGPKDVDMLMSIAKLEREFPNLETILIREIEREVSEGKGHSGLASVVQFIGRKIA